MTRRFVYPRPGEKQAAHGPLKSDTQFLFSSRLCDLPMFFDHRPIGRHPSIRNEGLFPDRGLEKWRSGPSPVKRGYRHVGINGRPLSEKRTSRDLALRRIRVRLNAVFLYRPSDCAKKSSDPSYYSEWRSYNSPDKPSE